MKLYHGLAEVAQADGPRRPSTSATLRRGIARKGAFVLKNLLAFNMLKMVKPWVVAQVLCFLSYHPENAGGKRVGPFTGEFIPQKSEYVLCGEEEALAAAAPFLYVFSFFFRLSAQCA